MSRVHVFLIIFIYIALILLTFYAAWFVTLSHVVGWPSPDDWKNFYSLAGVGVAAVSGIMGAWASFRNLAAQAKTSLDLERMKKVLEKSIPAYGSLFAAANTYYRALAPLETGSFSLDVIEIAEAKMKEAEGESLFVSDEYANVWNDFWQQARYTKEKVNKDLHTVEDRKKFWNEASKILAQALSEMRRLGQTHIQS